MNASRCRPFNRRAGASTTAADSAANISSLASVPVHHQAWLPVAAEAPSAIVVSSENSRPAPARVHAVESPRRAARSDATTPIGSRINTDNPRMYGR